MHHHCSLLIALVAGEPSGDLLGAGLMRALKAAHDGAIDFIGIGGPHMQSEGLVSLYPMETLSVMGLAEVVSRLPSILRIRKKLQQYLIAHKPDVFIGIDAPDFNLFLEKKLKQHGIKTVHYVSPSIWAWRQGRIHLIKQAVDLMLSLLPFEKQFYDQHNVSCIFVGHTLAEQIPITAQTTRAHARAKLKIAELNKKNWIAVLPGSRLSEIKRLGKIFLQTCSYLLEKDKSIGFLMPLLKPSHVDIMQNIQSQVAPKLPLFYFLDRSRDVISAADMVILASGTATLETMLLKRPMVVGYRLHPLSYWLAKRLVKVPYIALPNLLANETLVPELIQDTCTPEQIALTVCDLLKDGGIRQVKQFDRLHRLIAQSADVQAACAVLNLITGSSNHCSK